MVLVPFPYVTDFRKAKTRPALVVQNDIGNKFSSTIIVALISSSVPAKRYPMHFFIDHPSRTAKLAGLDRPSVVKMETPLTLPREAVLRKIGALTSESMDSVDTALAFSVGLGHVLR